MPMADLSHIQTISVKSHNVRRHFLDLITLTDEEYVVDSPNLQPSEVVDCLDRFSLWAGNMGAMRNPTSPLSLDERLFEAVDIREQINRQLDEITEAINDC